jgi:hypothetical protein
MNSFFNGIAEFFENIVFPFAESVGGSTNFIWILLGFIGTFGWMFWEVKNRTEPKED